jgi:peroxiredoxin
MSEHDPVITLLKELDGPADPRPEFADALRARLLEQLPQTNGVPARDGIRLQRRAVPARLRRPLLAGALALAVAAIVISAVVASGPSTASALDVIRQARAAFVHMPPFQAIYNVALNPDGTNPGGPRYVKKGATATVAVSYGGPHRLRTHILAEHGFTSDLSAGSYQIENGHWFGVGDAKGHFSSTTTSGTQALDFLSWRGAYPDWEQVCRSRYSKVLPDAQIAGRDARHIRCGNFHGDVWGLWIDRQTGLLLKLVGQVGGDDFFLGGGVGTSAKGGFEIQKLRYNPAFARGTFSPPPGAFDAAATEQATLAKLPPFRAVIDVRGPGAENYVEEGWRLNGHTWRTQVLVDRSRRRSGNFIGAGSFSVQAHGTLGSYDAHEKTFSRGSESLTALEDPAVQLLDLTSRNQDISPARCPIVGHARIAGRDTDHHRCAPYVLKATHHHKTWTTWEYWTDPATGLTLRVRVDGRDVVRVRSIKYGPHFPPGIFRFVPPPGSHNANQHATDPYYKTKLTPGKPAPNWHATTLAGKPFQLTDLRGRPTVLLMVPDFCTDPACNQVAPLEQAYRESNHRTQVVWVDTLGGTAHGANKLARLNHFTFPIIIDHKSASLKAWAFQGYPYWLLLDARGGVIESRLGRQSLAQIEQLLAKG